jgi:hypothetical protein
LRLVSKEIAHNGLLPSPEVFGEAERLALGVVTGGFEVGVGEGVQAAGFGAERVFLRPGGLFGQRDRPCYAVGSCIPGTRSLAVPQPKAQGAGDL